MRLLLFGSGAFGVPTFAALHAAHEVVALAGPPDRPAGRKRVLTPAPAVAWAREAGVEPWRSENVNDPAFVARAADAGVDASVVIAFGQKLGPPLLAAMGRLSVNLHGSLLPAWRGAAPVQRSVMAGEAVTGVSVIALAERMDAGAVYEQAELAVQPHETAGEVHDRLAALGPAAVLAVLARLEDGTLAPWEQDASAATHAAKLRKADGTTAFDAPPAAVAARINGLNPWPGCRVAVRGPAGEEAGFLLLRRAEPGGDRVDGEPPAAGTVDEEGRVAAAGGIVRLLEVQVPGRGVIPLAGFRRGGGLPRGSVLHAVEA
ncbi:methionyl-tRNA formyltransferase [Phycisphaera mikurensis]|uniref:methionyl-tRNA formyltransferase n=1 Tax=Phycisphaera mikurensis (strain NBRC 102666 / KCTC 22515 / FYK2301M01) TaxID=1142394 RepID=I0IIJ3_PHYMF|nr:methionyl-tRNA formyltransferase [Phycisphaera mikurensis]MBB6442762.1 methionyl-tRNA formyltransferase [Phycisphaera mikurensis]BAM05081.1 methionyl-tRNA formyltransferase [Phycisphaera mikurensis NBRC 102666]